jgi:hypothetical protein
MPTDPVKRKASQQRYDQSDKGKANKQAWNQSDKGQANKQRYAQSDKGQANKQRTEDKRVAQHFSEEELAAAADKVPYCPCYFSGGSECCVRVKHTGLSLSQTQE